MSAAVPCMTELTASRSPSDARLPVRRADLRHRPPPAEERRHVAVALRLLDRPRDEVLHVREAREVRVDVLLRLVARDLEVLGQAERRDAVDDPEVDHLGDVALVLRERRRILAEHLGRGRRVDVLAARERLAQLRLAGDVREDAQLDLRVVGATRAGARARRRTRSGSRARARCGSGSPAGSGSTSRAGPVDATAWLKCVCRRPSSREISDGSGWRYVLSSFEYSRHSSITPTISCSWRIERSTRRVGRVARLALAARREPELLEEDPARPAASSRA